MVPTNPARMVAALMPNYSVMQRLPTSVLQYHQPYRIPYVLNWLGLVDCERLTDSNEVQLGHDSWSPPLPRHPLNRSANRAQL